MKTLREWRIYRVLSGRDLAAAARITHKTLVDLELGRRTPTFETIRRLSDALSVVPTEVEEFDDALARRSGKERRNDVTG